MKYALIKDEKVINILEGTQAPAKGDNDEVVDISGLKQKIEKGWTYLKEPNSFFEVEP